MAGLLLDLLQRSPQGLSANQLSRAVNVPVYEVLNALSTLQNRQSVVLRRGTVWQATGSIKPPVPHPAVLGEASAPAASPELGDRQHRQKTDTNSSRWAEFRNLCHYYAECVRLEQGTRVSAYADQEGTRFVPFAVACDWRAISGGQPVAVTVPAAWRDFIRLLRSDRSGSALYIGAPVDLFVGKDKKTGDAYRIISPLFVLPVEHSLDSGLMLLRPTGPFVANHGWLESKFHNPDDRRLFLELCGLQRPSADDEGNTSDPEMLLPSLPNLMAAVRTYYPDWWREAGDLRQLSSEPKLATIQRSGTYNRAVLIAPRQLKYTARVYRELLRLADHVPDEQLDVSAFRHLFPHQQPLAPAPISKDLSGKVGGSAVLPDPKTSVEHSSKINAATLTGVAEYAALNQEQREACHNALESDLCLVTGPPGTGKSRVVAHVMANAGLRGMPTVFSSRNHQAIEAVEPHLNALVEPRMLVVRLSSANAGPKVQ